MLRIRPSLVRRKWHQKFYVNKTILDQHWHLDLYCESQRSDTERSSKKLINQRRAWNDSSKTIHRETTTKLVGTFAKNGRKMNSEANVGVSKGQS